MKILFVNEKCGYFGGVEQNVAETADGLRARGHEGYLAYGAVTDREVDAYKARFAEALPCVELGFSVPDQPAYPFEEIVHRVVPDVVYFHKVADLQFCEHLLSSMRTVRMVHDHDLCCPRRHKYFMFSGRVCHHKADWRCWLDGAFLARDPSSRTGFALVSIRDKIKEMRRNRHLGTLLVGSRFMREELLQNGFSEEKVHILPPVVRRPDHPPTAVPDEQRILYVGQLIRGKGVDLLLHALREVSCEFTATIVGTGNAQAKLEVLCQQLGLADRVRFRGWVSHEELGQFYSAAKVVAVPSRWPEPFGMIGLEAMHYGRPVAADDVGGIPDWLEHEVTGLLVPEQDTTALARSFERVLTDTELAATLGRNAYEHVWKHYSFDRYLDRLETHLSGEDDV